MSKIKAGDVFPTNEGGMFVVVEYVNRKEIIIRHLDEYGYTHAVHGSNIVSGGIRNPYFPSFYYVGHIGIGEYKITENGKMTSAYATWSGMMKRVYHEDTMHKNPTYSDASVSKEWHCYQDFAEWFYKQPNAGRKGFAIDKDLLVLGNKVYGSDFCTFVPQAVNSLLTDHRSARGKYPQGVSLSNGRYQAEVSIDGKTKHLGKYSTPEEAHEVYKKAKAEQVRVVANRYKDVLHPTVYENLITWELK